MAILPPNLPPWRAIIYDGYSVSLAEGARTFFRIAIEPSCTAIGSELAGLNRGPDDESIARWDTLRTTQLELHRSFALALGGMWERHFRRHLAHSLSIIGPKEKVASVEPAQWKELCNLFEETRGFSLKRLASYDDLELLHEVASAVRHGNGRATRDLHGRHKELFSYEPIRSHFSYFALGSEPVYSIHRLDISFELLVRFEEAIADFWETIRALQVSSAR